MAETQDQHIPEDERFASAAERRRRSYLVELWDFARHNNKWWLIPIIVILLLIGLLVVFTSTGAGALLYPLF